jgi:hypothetical protein
MTLDDLITAIAGSPSFRRQPVDAGVGDGGGDGLAAGQLQGDLAVDRAFLAIRNRAAQLVTGAEFHFLVAGHDDDRGRLHQSKHLAAFLEPHALDAAARDQGGDVVIAADIHPDFGVDRAEVQTR